MTIEGIDSRVNVAFSSNGEYLVVKVPGNGEFLSDPTFKTLKKKWIRDKEVWVFPWQVYDVVMDLLRQYFPAE